MGEFVRTEAKDFVCNPFRKIGEEWMLISAEDKGKVNAMTASWGGLGVLWGCNVAFIFVRQSRYTKQFIDASGTFALSFFDGLRYKKTLAYLGKVSGRDEDKIEKSGLTLVNDGKAPYFAEAETVLLCEKLSRHTIDKQGILKDGIISSCYGGNDMHDMYVGKITDVLVR